MVRRRFGPDFEVRFVDARSREAEESSWGSERPYPLVIIDGTVFSKGEFSFKAVLRALKDRQGEK